MEEISIIVTYIDFILRTKLLVKNNNDKNIYLINFIIKIILSIDNFGKPPLDYYH